MEILFNLMKSISEKRITAKGKWDKDHDYIFSFNQAKDFDSVYILKPIMQDDVTWLKKKTILLVYEIQNI